MNIETLKVFRDLVDTGSFSKSAELNYVSQSAVSQQIKKLESVFKCNLFNRVKDKITLTPCGQKLYEAASKIVLLYDNTLTSIRQISYKKGTGEIKISTIHSAGIYLLQKYIRRFIEKNPLTKVSVEYRQFQQVYADVISGRSNIGIVACPYKKVKEVVLLPMCKEEMILVSSTKHKLANYKTVPLAYLNNLDFIFFDKFIPSRKYLDDIFKKYGINVNVKMELDDIETIKSVVQAGVGVSLLPLSAIREDEKNNLHIARFSNLNIFRPLFIVLKKKKVLSDSVKLMVDILKDSSKKE